MISLNPALVIATAAAALGGTAALITRIKGGRSPAFKVIFPPPPVVKAA